MVGFPTKIFFQTFQLHAVTPQSSLRLASSPAGEPFLSLFHNISSHMAERHFKHLPASFQLPPLKGEGDRRQAVVGAPRESFPQCITIHIATPLSATADISAQGTPFGCPFRGDKLKLSHTITPPHTNKKRLPNRETFFHKIPTHCGNRCTKYLSDQAGTLDTLCKVFLQEYIHNENREN